MDRNVEVLTHHWVGHCLKPMLKDFNKLKYNTDKTITLGYIIYIHQVAIVVPTHHLYKSKWPSIARGRTSYYWNVEQILNSLLINIL